jgi:hypothetical protein
VSVALSNLLLGIYTNTRNCKGANQTVVPTTCRWIIDYSIASLDSPRRFREYIVFIIPQTDVSVHIYPSNGTTYVSEYTYMYYSIDTTLNNVYRSNDTNVIRIYSSITYIRVCEFIPSPIFGGVRLAHFFI